MTRKVVLICILGAVSVAICPERQSKADSSKISWIDTPTGMIEYLHKQRLPVLESVEVWQNEYGPGLKLTTAHYEVFATLLEPLMLTQVPGFMESAYRGYNDQLPEPVETKTKFTIYLFAERKQWEDFTKVFAGPQAPPETVERLRTLYGFDQPLHIQFGRYAARLVPWGSAAIGDSAEPRFRPDGSYLISGGLGGTGLEIAGLLAEGGAGQVVLLGRSGRPAAGTPAQSAEVSSSWQVAEQPSPPAELLSSQPSPGSTTTSPRATSPASSWRG